MSSRVSPCPISTHRSCSSTGTDTRAAQIFTLAHELAHIWLGESALDNLDPGSLQDEASERWCSQVGAEIFVPSDDLAARYRPDPDFARELDRLARIFKTSTLVVLRRIRDIGYLKHANYWDAYHAELDRVRALSREARGDGGNFYNTQPARVSKRFARAVITNTLEGQTLYRDAFQMLGFRKVSAFNELARRLGVT